jgi:tRNA (guanine37-N1)-methyltransferase
MFIDILSLFPDYFRTPLEQSILKRAIEKGILQIELVNVRDFAPGRHHKVDDHPYGGGPGMVMMPGPVCDAIRSRKKEGSYVVFLSPQGSLLTASMCQRLAQKEHLILLCGHYRGVDERAIRKEVNEEISIGNYVLTSGAPAAMVLVDAVCRFVPGVLGNEESALRDSFQERPFEGPQYTRPEIYEEMRVPEELRSGHHERIREWQEKEALRKWKEREYETE